MNSLLGKCRGLLTVATRGLTSSWNPTTTASTALRSSYSVFSHRRQDLPQQHCIPPHCVGHTHTSLLPVLPAVVQHVNTFKSKVVLRRRCKDCYFVKRRGRWYIYCRSKPRHKQRSLKVDNQDPYQRKYVTDQDFW